MVGFDLDLNKGFSLDLTKSLKNVRVGIGWDMVNNFSSSGDADLDLSAFLIEGNGYVNRVEDVVYFNNQTHYTGSVKSSGDNRTGEGDGDDEEMFVDFDRVPQNITNIVFLATIHEAQTRHQTFGMVQNAYVKLYDDDTGQTLANFNLTDEYSTDTAIVAVSLNRTGSGWSFKAIGEGQIADLIGLTKINFKQYF